MQRKTLHKQYKKLGISAVRRIGFSFFAVILIGSILLSLPMSHTIHSTSSYLDHLFVATSATCVTGLVTHVTASEYTLFEEESVTSPSSFSKPEASIKVAVSSAPSTLAPPEA